jgi:hypothetical protein
MLLLATETATLLESLAILGTGTPLSERTMMGWFGRLAIGAVAGASLAAQAEARITYLEITKTESAFGGQSFGDAGA